MMPPRISRLAFATDADAFRPDALAARKEAAGTTRYRCGIAKMAIHAAGLAEAAPLSRI